MALIIYGGNGTLSKEECLKTLENLKFYNKDFTRNDFKMRGLMEIVKYERQESYEEFVIEKMIIVKSVVNLHGDAALDRYLELQEPNVPKDMYFALQISALKEFGFDQLIRDSFIPMTKDHFSHYLEVYNKYINENTF